MSSRSRFLAFGSAGLLVVAGGICAAVVRGLLGELLAIVLISLGLVAATSLVFLEIGLSEDRERARDEARRQTRSRLPAPTHTRLRSATPRKPRRPA
jgi:hypothetical protein